MRGNIEAIVCTTPGAKGEGNLFILIPEPIGELLEPKSWQMPFSSPVPPPSINIEPPAGGGSEQTLASSVPHPQVLLRTDLLKPVGLGPGLSANFVNGTHAPSSQPFHTHHAPGNHHALRDLA